MKLSDIVQNKGTEIFHTVPKASIQDVVQQMVDCRCGALVVCEPDNSTKLMGIISERDILQTIATNKKDLSLILVEEVMTTIVYTAKLECPVEDAMGLMTEKRIRHLPIVEDDRLQGIISIGDLVKTQHDNLSMENHFLKNYLQG